MILSMQGLLACEDCDYVFIHDGARPFVTEAMLERGVFGVQKTGACVIGMPSKDTIKISDKEGFVQSDTGPQHGMVCSDASDFCIFTDQIGT